MEGRAVRLDLTRQVAAVQRAQPRMEPLDLPVQTHPGPSCAAQEEVVDLGTPPEPEAQVDQEVSLVVVADLALAASLSEAPEESEATESAGWSHYSSHEIQP